MKLKITLELDNAAFGEDGETRLREVRRILHRMFTDCYTINPGDWSSLQDYNGNTVGKWSIKP